MCVMGQLTTDVTYISSHRVYRILRVFPDLSVNAKIFCAFLFVLVVMLAGTVQIDPMESRFKILNLTTSDSAVYNVESDVDTSSIYQLVLPLSPPLSDSILAHNCLQYLLQHRLCCLSQCVMGALIIYVTYINSHWVNIIIGVSTDLSVNVKIFLALHFDIVVTLAGTVQIGHIGSRFKVPNQTPSDSAIYYIDRC